MKTLRYPILAGLFLIPLIPLYVATDGFFPFIVGKNFAFRAVIDVVLALWVLLALFEPEYRPRKSYLLYAVGALALVATLSSVFGENVYRSFWSNFERSEGLLTYFHVWAYFVILGSMLTTEKLWKWFWHVSIGVSMVVGIYGLIQLGNSLGSGNAQRLDARLGNAIYLAVYMLFHVFFTLFLAVRKYLEERKWSNLYFFYGFALVIQLVILTYTETRGAFFGLIGGLLLAALISGIMLPGKPRKIALAGMGVILAIVLLGVVLRVTGVAQSIPLLSRYTNVSLTEGTVQTRFIIWHMALKGFKETPILGVGLENFNLVFNKYYDPRLYAAEQWYDRPHNVVLDWLSTGGILGFLAYLSLYAAALYYLFRGTFMHRSFWASVWQKIAPGKENTFSIPERAILTGLLAGFLFQNLTVFDNITSHICFYAILAYIHFRATREERDGALLGTTRAIEPRDYAIASVLVVAAFVALIWGTILPRSANQNLLLGLVHANQNPELAYEHFDKVLTSKTMAITEAREQLTIIAIQVARGNVATPVLKEKFLKRAVEEMTAQVTAVPDDARYRIMFANFLRTVQQPAASVRELDTAIMLTPGKPMVYIERAFALLDLGMVDAAIADMKTAFELEKSQDRARLFYAGALIQGKQTEAADALLLERYGTTTVVDDFLLNSHAKAGNLLRARDIWIARIAQSPLDLQPHVSLAAVYLKLGRKDLAIAELRKAIALEPQFKAEGEKYIKDIEAGREPGS